MRTPFWTIAALSLSAVLSACATDGPAPLSRDIGPPPAYLAAEQVAPARRGESAIVVADRYRRGVDRANAKIGCARADWQSTRDSMLAAKVVGGSTECASLPKAPAPRRKP